MRRPDVPSRFAHGDRVQILGASLLAGQSAVFQQMLPDQQAIKSRDVARVVACARAAGLSIGSIEVTPRHGGDATIRVYSQNGSLADALAMELEAEQKAADETWPMQIPGPQ